MTRMNLAVFALLVVAAAFTAVSCGASGTVSDPGDGDGGAAAGDGTVAGGDGGGGNIDGGGIADAGQ